VSFLQAESTVIFPRINWARKRKGAKSTAQNARHEEASDFAPFRLRRIHVADRLRAFFTRRQAKVSPHIE